MNEVISTYWDGVEQFSASEAAYLMLGLEPEINKPETRASHASLLREMNVSFIDACALFRFCLENGHDWAEVSVKYLDRDADEVLLPSIELRQLARQCKGASSDAELAEFGSFAMRWLDTSIDRFSCQRFDREKISQWVYWKNIYSVYSFAPTEPPSPAERRQHVAEILKECDGNKSEAARRLGISRTRVDQLLAPPGSRKGSQKKPAGPFDMLLGPEGKATP